MRRTRSGNNCTSTSSVSSSPRRVLVSETPPSPIPAAAASRKRRRTMMDAFQSLSIDSETTTIGSNLSFPPSTATKQPPQHHHDVDDDDDDDDDADSTWAVAGTGHDDTFDDDDDNDHAEDEPMFSDQELAQKAVVYRLALPSEPTNVVDAKIEELIRQSRLEAQQQQQQRYAKDDWDVDMCYFEKSNTSSVTRNVVQEERERPRSNSMPGDWEGSSSNTGSDVEMDLL